MAASTPMGQALMRAIQRKRANEPSPLAATEGNEQSEAEKDHFAHMRCIERMATVDAMSREMRACVHDFGLTMVQQFLQHGVQDPQKIRALVVAVHRGSTEVGKREGQRPFQVTSVASLLDNVMLALGLPPLGREVMSRLIDHGFLVVSVKPSRAMVEASLNALTQHGRQNQRFSRESKHRVRLADALKAGARDRGIKVEDEDA